MQLASTASLALLYNVPSAAEMSISRRAPARADSNKLEPADRAAHDWYRFVLSFPPHLVRDYVGRFNVEPEGCVLDPFCGTGTTLVECKKLGIRTAGVEAHPMSYLATRTKLDWSPDPDEFEALAASIAERAITELDNQGIVDDPQPNLIRESPMLAPLRSLPPDAAKLLLSNSISPLPLHKTLALLDSIDRAPRFKDHFQLALARALVSTISNLHFGPEVGVGPPKEDAPVVSAWLGRVLQMAHDLRGLRRLQTREAVVFNADSRSLKSLLKRNSITAVFTSPPYPNEKDYTRTTRLETVLLGLIRDKPALQKLKRTMVRSNTRGVYKEDDDHRWISEISEISRVAEEIEARRIALGKTSGFERLYARVTKLYFGGMARHFEDLRPTLRKGAMLGYVVGDQASYLRVMIRTGQILASIAERLGYEVVSIDLFRTRLATATREQLREEVVVLRWRGN
jgi:tRNA G10  N-methylase Trm11